METMDEEILNTKHTEQKWIRLEGVVGLKVDRLQELTNVLTFRENGV